MEAEPIIQACLGQAQPVTPVLVELRVHSREVRCDGARAAHREAKRAEVEERVRGVGVSIERNVGSVAPDSAGKCRNDGLVFRQAEELGETAAAPRPAGSC